MCMIVYKSSWYYSPISTTFVMYLPIVTIFSNIQFLKTCSVLLSLLCWEKDMVKLLVGEFVDISSQRHQPLRSWWHKGITKFLIMVRAQWLRNCLRSWKLLSLSVMLCLLLNMIFHYHYHVCYRTHLASVVEPAKAPKQTGAVAALQQLVARSSSGQDDPSLHQAPIISSRTGC